MEEINKNFLLNQVKSSYILKRILDNLERNKFFNLIRYNKKLQKRLEKNIDDYKNEYLKVELEIIPIGNNFNIFINQSGKESYYHFYINDNKEELKRNYLLRNDKATKIKVILDGEIKSFSKLLVLKFERFNFFNAVHLLNINSIFVTLSVLNLVKIISSKD